MIIALEIFNRVHRCLDTSLDQNLLLRTEPFENFQPLFNLLRNLQVPKGTQKFIDDQVLHLLGYCSALNFPLELLQLEIQKLAINLFPAICSTAGVSPPLLLGKFSCESMRYIHQLILNFISTKQFHKMEIDSGEKHGF